MKLNRRQSVIPRILFDTIKVHTLVLEEKTEEQNAKSVKSTELDPFLKILGVQVPLPILLKNKCMKHTIDIESCPLAN